MTGTEVMLRPCPKIRMFNSITLGKGSAHEVLSRAVNSNLGRHTPDQTDFIGNFCCIWQIFRDLKICFCFNGSTGPLCFSTLRVEGINMAHSSPDLQKDDSLGLAKSITCGERVGSFEIWQNRQPEGTKGTLFNKLSSGIM